MKISLIPLAAWTSIALLGGTSVALADSAAATCDVSKDGDHRQSTSGPCTFSQRQGHINLDLKNGISFSLVPTDQKWVYQDGKGHRVVRTVTGNSEEFRWDGGRLIVMTYAGGSGGPAQPTASAGGSPDSFDTICGVIVGGKNYRYRCGATDFYSGGHKVRTELRYPDQTIQLTWRPGNSVGLQFEGMVPMEARYATSEGETNFVFEDKTYFYYSDKGMAQWEWQHFRE